MLELPARYYRHTVDPGIENTEANLHCEDRVLPLPAADTALVLVDCWCEHHIAGLADRMRPVIDDQIVPALHAARDSPLTVVHCPGPAVAAMYSEFRVPGASDDVSRDGAPNPSASEWPPDSFRDRTGDARVFARYEDEQAMAAADFDWPPDGIDGALEPAAGEPVVADGEELHRLLSDRGIRHLV